MFPRNPQARTRRPAMTVDGARAGRRDDRAPRTPAASIDRRAASPWMDAPGPASPPAGPFSHARRGERDDVEPERRAREADVAAAAGGSRRRARRAAVRERVHARGEARAGGEGGRGAQGVVVHGQGDDTRRGAPDDGEEGQGEGTRRARPAAGGRRRRRRRHREAQDIARILFSVEQIREWRRRAIAAQVAMRWRRKQQRESTWSFAVEDGVRHVLGFGPAPDPDDVHGGRLGPVRPPPSDEGYTRRRSGYAPHVLARGGAVAWFPKKPIEKPKRDERDPRTLGSIGPHHDAREPWEIAADERDARTSERKRLPHVTRHPSTRQPEEVSVSDERGPKKTLSAEEKEAEKDRLRRATAERRARSATFVSKAVSFASAFSPFKKAASSVGAFKESAEDVRRARGAQRRGGGREDRASHLSGEERDIGRARGPEKEGEGGERAPRDEARGGGRGATRARGRGAQGEGRGGRQGHRGYARVSNHEGLEVLEGADRRVEGGGVRRGRSHAVEASQA